MTTQDGFQKRVVFSSSKLITTLKKSAEEEEKEKRQRKRIRRLIITRNNYYSNSTKKKKSRKIIVLWATYTSSVLIGLSAIYVLLNMFRIIFQPGEIFALGTSRPCTYVNISDLRQTVMNSVRSRAINYLHWDVVWISAVQCGNVGMYLKLWHNRFLSNSLNTNFCHLSHHWTLRSEPLRVSISKKKNKKDEKEIN